MILALDDNGKTHQFHEDEVLNIGIPIYRTCDLDGIHKWFTHYKKLKRILREKGPFDVIHCNMDLFNGINLMAAKSVGIPTRICHSHISESQYGTEGVKKLIVRVYRFLLRKLIKYSSTKMLGCSCLANEYMYGDSWKEDQRCEIVYNGIDLDRFCLDSVLKENRKGIISIGRLTSIKNPYRMIDIIEELSKLRDDFCFTWVGDGILRDELEQKVKEKHLEKKISFLGRRNNIPELLKKNQYFLFPSLFEGLPITLIEAQCMGLDCFVSDSITKEVDVGLCHYISLKRSSKKWAEIISREMDRSLSKKIVDKEKLKKFDIKNTVKRLEEIYG